MFRWEHLIFFHDDFQLVLHIHSLRLPGVIAKHELIFGAQGENLSIIHNSSDRESFMPGVLIAVDHVIENNEIVIGLEKILGL